MCGLMGWVTSWKNGFSSKEMDVAKDLLWLTQLRGQDSTGVASILNNKDTGWAKDVGTPEYFYLSKNFDEWERAVIQRGWAMIGHCRAATKGTVNVANAHPFDLKKENKERIILVHNGTLTDNQQLDGKDKFDVDSEWLAHCVATLGPTETFAKIQGPIATMWIDTEDWSLNIYRNYERPLHWAKTKAGTIIIQSEEEGVEWAAKRAKEDVEAKGMFDTLTHYKLPFQSKEWEKTTIEKIYPKVIHTPHSYSRRRGFYGINSEMYDEDDDCLPGFSVKREEYRSPLQIIYSKPRGYFEDVGHIFDDLVSKVEFTKVGRRTTITNGACILDMAPPYREHLVALYTDDERKTVTAEFNENGTISKRTIRKKESVPALPAPKPTQEDSAVKAYEACMSNLKLRKGKRVKFSTKMDGQMHRHIAACDDTQPQLFKYYNNSLDGEVKVGDKITVEAFQFSPIANGIGHKVIATRVKERQDKMIEYTFFDTKSGRDALKAISFFTGVVDSIRLTTKDVFKERSSVVEVRLRDVKPATSTESTLTETNETTVH